MTYAFVFTGEFGYELFNWQGVVRKWVSENKKPQDKIIICSRTGLNNIYDFADRYINISQVESYNNTVADCYRGYVWEEKKDLDFDDWPIIGSGPKYDKLVQQIENDIKNIVDEDVDRWVWSHTYENFNGLHFGLGGPGRGSIYSGAPFLGNNLYKKIIIPNLNEIKTKIQPNIPIDLDQPFILVQTGYRGGKGYTNKSKVKINHEKIFKDLNTPILYLNFDSGRYWDSTSSFNKTSYKCNNFDEQACLILLSEKCIFTTEGDFRSHTYIPPMLGKDVHVVTSKEVLRLPSCSSRFWNENIFKFGGQMYTYEYESFNLLNLKT